MAFQRSYSKVWWGSDNTANSNPVQSSSGSGFYSLDVHSKPYSGNLSRIQEVDDENSKLWRSHDSPGSLRSQDSGFSDNDESPNSRATSHTSSPQSKLGSPTSFKTIETPPTVIRRKSALLPPDAVSRRISFSAPTSPVMGESRRKDLSDSTSDLLSKIDRISFVTPTSEDEESTPCKCPSTTSKDRSIRRRRVTTRKTRRNLIKSTAYSSEEGLTEFDLKEYNNETMYIGGTEDDSFETLKSEDDFAGSPLKVDYQSRFTASTSTPKAKKEETTTFAPIEDHHRSSYGSTMPYYFEYNNPLLNGHQLSVQYWLDDMRSSYDHEVMSTLQTKSIAQEAFRNLKITSNTVTKIIRQLQTSSIGLENDFERLERILTGEQNVSLHTALLSAHDLIEGVDDFTQMLERRSVFFTECRPDRKKFEDTIEQIKSIVKDTRISLEKQHYMQVDSLHEDILVLKRCILITLRLVFEKLIRVIVQNIEGSQCDLMLRANLNMIATLSNIDYEGFAALGDAFDRNRTVRSLLMVCMDNKYSSVRALALRALATICGSAESIRQFGEEGGIEIVRDILLVKEAMVIKRSEPERREAVSLLTQLTAPWHGQQLKIEGLKDCIEGLVEGICDIIEKTECCQTLLLCAASLNNLSRVELTSVYSMMSNEAIVKLKKATEQRGPGASIFLYEQIVTMLYNMSANKKCHSHLAHGSCIEFLTAIFQSQFHESFGSRAEADAHRRTIKTILHVFTRLIHESSIGQEILERHFIPIFSKVERNLNGGGGVGDRLGKDISLLSMKLNESLSHKLLSPTTADSRNVKLNLARQESYV